MAEEIVCGAGLRDDVEAGVLSSRAMPSRSSTESSASTARTATAPGSGAQGWEVAAQALLLELEDPLWVGQVRQEPEAEVAELPLRRQLGCERLRRDDLATVARVGDPERAVDVDADVAVVVQSGLCGVEADPDPHRGRPRVSAEAPLRVDGCSRGRVARSEGCEQLVAAGVDLVACGLRDGLPQKPSHV